MLLQQQNPAKVATITSVTEGDYGADEPQDVVQKVCSQLTTAGPAIVRCVANVGTLQPDVLPRRFLWHLGHDGQVEDAGSTSSGSKGEAGLFAPAE